MHTLPEYVESYFEHMREHGRNPETIKRYRYDVIQFFKWLEGIQLKDISQELILTDIDLTKYVQYKQSKKQADASTRRQFSVLNALFKHLNLNIKFDVKKANIESQRPLTDKDFISDQEFKKLVKSIKTLTNSNMRLAAARDYLIDRNVSIVNLMRFYGLTPKEVASINMNDINFAQNQLTLHSDTGNRKIILSDGHNKTIVKYYNSIPKDRRPNFHSDNPLFVAFYNVTMSYKFEYQSNTPGPKRLSMRGIQEMIKEEVIRADIRKVSAVNLRNRCILDALMAGKTDEEIIKEFNLANSFSLHRYKTYIKKKQPS